MGNLMENTPSLFPSLFVSHGAPSLLLEQNHPTSVFLSRLGSWLGRPSAILVVSAHWNTRDPTISLADSPETLHDFFGFPSALYQQSWPAPGAPQLARQVATHLRQAGFTIREDAGRGRDHGAWAPLSLMYPAADVPTIQLSIPSQCAAAEHLALGRALSPFRRHGVLILGSGSATHNLAALDWQETTPTPAWASAFTAWLETVLTAEDSNGRPLVANREQALAQWLSLAPAARMAHPTDEHFLPLPLAFAAAGPDATGHTLHAHFTFASLAMHAWAFTGAGETLPPGRPGSLPPDRANPDSRPAAPLCP